MGAKTKEIMVTVPLVDVEEWTRWAEAEGVTLNRWLVDCARYYVADVQAKAEQAEGLTGTEGAGEQ